MTDHDHLSDHDELMDLLRSARPELPDELTLPTGAHASAPRSDRARPPVTHRRGDTLHAHSRRRVRGAGSVPRRHPGPGRGLRGRARRCHAHGVRGPPADHSEPHPRHRHRQRVRRRDDRADRRHDEQLRGAGEPALESYVPANFASKGPALLRRDACRDAACCNTSRLQHDDRAGGRERRRHPCGLSRTGGSSDHGHAVLAEEAHLCLDCRACETACPSGVRYGYLVEETRAADRVEAVSGLCQLEA